MKNEKAFRVAYYIISTLFYGGLGFASAHYGLWFLCFAGCHFIIVLVERQMYVIQINKVKTMFDELVKRYHELGKLINDHK